jgi:hypothetical protein
MPAVRAISPAIGLAQSEIDPAEQDQEDQRDHRGDEQGAEAARAVGKHEEQGASPAAAIEALNRLAAQRLRMLLEPPHAFKSSARLLETPHAF